MENQHRKITGYRELSQAEIDLMNEIKAHGQKSEDLIKKVHAHINAQYDKVMADFRAQGDSDSDAYAAFQHWKESTPRRWVSIGGTDLQTGLMALTRAVAQPTTF